MDFITTPLSARLARLTLSGALLASAFVTQAQMLPGNSKNARLYNSVSVHLNVMNYFGDLAPKPAITSFRFGATRPNIGISIQHRFAPRLSGRASLSYGRITGDDAKSADQNDADAVYRYNRNLSFRSDVVELAAVGIVELFENRGTYMKRRDFAPYLFLGVAGFYHNPKAERDGKWIALQPLGTEGQKTSGKGYPTPYRRLQVSIPFGLGADYKLNRQLNIGYEIGWRKTFTDYLDDVSTKYADPVDLAKVNGNAVYFGDRSDPALRTGGQFSNSYGKGQQRGTTNEKDWYIVSGFHLSYIMIPKVQSPKFR